MISTYDFQLKTAADLYLPGVDWRLLKAQLQAESALNPSVTSPAGAMGIAQFMPKTWRDMQIELDIPEHITAYDADHAITAAAYYMQKMYSVWTTPRPDADRYCLALASYNAGLGNVLRAQRKASMATDYYNIIRSLKYVTGATNATETRNYVERIFKTFGEYLLRGR